MTEPSRAAGAPPAQASGRSGPPQACTCWASTRAAVSPSPGTWSAGATGR